MATVDALAVRALVERISTSPGFMNSERLCRFLRFTVDAWLAGTGDEIKEYLIGREVFDRDDRYDPRTDPIVRVEARRLRRKLEEYYAGDGRGEALQIRYEKGSYVPSVVTPEAVPVAEPAVVGRRWWLIGGGAVLGVAGLGIWVGTGFRSREKVAVLPARWVWKTEEFTLTPYDVDVAERVAADLAGRGVGVVAWPVVQSRAQKEAKLDAIVKELGASRSLLIAVRVEASGTRVTAFLIDSASNRKLGVWDEEGVDLSRLEQRQQVARSIAEKMIALR